ncbi:MAG TPA: phosphoglucomutase (alpha-D-glucose-1,6-bisphosphate-dependent) [Sulfurovum sp.]|jgi:phosphoglucomutase|nr:MAG: phosphoglucomutase, alpha-D-glucose phosphate-specific [Sulfurovum sp. 35-42-20]OYY56604.1 MAG: phosphoglucomutase, alpha-D-glucose phosphate-specific [Sulfurovum sp. 28-43-6]OYZ25662.1 MAG: phosphoglucomutase, alpha-D-glucose phosphate-specific [Sulfurovum sp. 16-42-52]OYZ50205.1 MAG: phosphoglucomutase, alpha-D-glucose phosphate-specific [Sulfurovum sp. 24-42-9]OZA45779.1 MAG: phosphoglucomutase, alpha-D-glucose phosphate-specific [Sulfurovum sp. 17-42-90]OZA60251.1 MAG: phosphogluco
MALHPHAGKLAPKSILVNIPRLISEYYTKTPDTKNPTQRIAFGTSGHRGSSLLGSFNENHILAVTQAVCDYRKEAGITGILFMGMDTHALSYPAQLSALQVLCANGVTVHIAKDLAYTPTPVISHAILTHNKDTAVLCDGIVITPSHNPPADGGFKYNPPHGGPADTDVTDWIEKRANALMENGLQEVKKITLNEALSSEYLVEYDYVTPYVDDLENVIDMEAIAKSGIFIGADAMGGSGMAYYTAIKERYGLNMEVFNDTLDSTFSFMHCDKDGKIRMDCSSSYAMAGLVAMKEKYDIAFGNDTDFDRHGIVTKSVGLMNPNHYLSVAINYLAQNRPLWKSDLGIGKTLVSSSMIDRVAASLEKKVIEVPVGFKWFVEGLTNGTVFFGGEESAGASFLRKDGSVWSTDKDGIIMTLLAAEILATTSRDPGEHYLELTQKFGAPIYARIDAPATLEQAKKLKNLNALDIKATMLAGEAIEAVLTHAPGNGAAIGGLKVVAKNGWFALRPSGTEPIYKIYAESFIDEVHLKQIQDEAQEIVSTLF